MISMAYAMLLSLTPAHASAVRLCNYTGEVTVAEVKDGALTVTLTVATAEAGGHSAGPARCTAPGETLLLDVTNDAEALAMGVQVGDQLRAVVRDVYNHTPDGPRHFHAEEIQERIAP